MRQVPYYLIIGNGRVARHFRHYLSLMQIPYLSWHRDKSFTDLQEQLKHATHILLLISDSSIEHFLKENLKTSTAIRIHFSGSHVSQFSHGAHPLMTFDDHQYTLQQYQTIPFIIDDDAPDFDKLLPGLPNPHTRLQKSLKAKYHALCVLSGNFSCMLWQKLFSDLEHELKIPAEMAFPYLKQQTQNLLTNYKTALTGPLVRNDTTTIKNNLHALEHDPFQEIYKSFISCYQQLKSEA